MTGADILTHAAPGVTPSAEDETWADVCAAAIEALIATKLADVTVDPGSDAESELIRAALQDGAAAYIARRAPHGQLSTGPGGETERLGADIVIALAPVFRRYGTPGIA